MARKKKRKKYTPDIVLGWIFLLPCILGLIFGMLLIAGGSFVAYPEVAKALHNTKQSLSGVTAMGGVAAVIGGLILFLSIAYSAIAIGLIRSSKTSFWFLAVGHGARAILSFAYPDPGGYYAGAILGTCICLYCVLRLTGTIGPKVV